MARLEYAPPPTGRQVGGATYSTGEVAVHQITTSCSWGVQPGLATVMFAGLANITVGQSIYITCGSHQFWGICKSVMPDVSTRGAYTTMTVEDNRCLLNWDVVFGEFNVSETTTYGRQRRRRWRHIYPSDFVAHLPTRTDGPLSAAAIVQALVNASDTHWNFYHCHPTTGAKVAGLHPALARAVFNIDCMTGKKLGAALAEVCEPLGIVFSVFGGPYDLVFARKGEGSLPGTPLLSDDRKLGGVLSEVPTRVKVVGGRNRYQIHQIPLRPDWARGWDAFFGEPWLLRDWIYANDPRGGTSGGQGNRLRAAARALEITVGEVADVLGSSFDDPRKFMGRPRRHMPASLYIQNIVFRSFALPTDFSFTGQFANVGLLGMQLVPEMIAEVTHSPTTGIMQYNLEAPASGPGYAIVRGYQVGQDAFRAIRPRDFNLTDWTNYQNVWQSIPFQIDDGGEEGDPGFVIFDQPVFRSSDLFTSDSYFNGYVGLKANPTFSIPDVRAALTVRGEHFLWNVGSGTRDDAVSFPSLFEEFILDASGTHNVPYADGQTAAQKAIDVGNSYLARQFGYTQGGFKRPMMPGAGGSYSSPTSPSGVCDRVTMTYSDQGYFETVDYTAERNPLAFVSDRYFDRIEIDKQLFPGQKELRDQANQLRLIAAALHADPKTLQSITEAYYGAGNTTEVTVSPPADDPVLIPLGSPLWSSGSAGSPIYADKYPEYSVYVGAAAIHNQSTAQTIPVVVASKQLVRVQGPVGIGDAVGAPDTGPNYFLVRSSDKPVGTAQGAVADGEIKLIEVRVGGSGGSGKVQQYIVRSVENDFLTCNTWDGSTSTSGAEDVFIAKPYELRVSDWDGQTVTTYGINIHYNYTDAVTRIASAEDEADETQIVIPAYINDWSIIEAMECDGLGIEGPDGPITLIETNSNRAFARV
ncbi:MAG TPA: hypothetical protein VNU68_09715 [Verrucomicrobiae bacterium]|nr:hypothetical protein [Verrucomicrobiae bacterium]